MPITPKDRQALATTRAKFRAMMNGLTPKQQSDRAHVIASGIRSADPLTRALAEQFVALEKVREGITAKERELTQIDEDVRQGGYRPRDPDWKGRLLTRKAELEKAIMVDHAHGLALMEDPLFKAEQEAINHFRNQEVAETKTRLVNEAVARKLAEAEQSDIDALADRIVGTRRFEQGKKIPGAAQ